MTRFENDFGGRIVVMGMTLRGNGSQSLYNYRRQRLFQGLLRWCCEDSVYTVGEPYVYTIMNRAIKPADCGFSAILTLINLGDDPIGDIVIRLPEAYKKASFCVLDDRGLWQSITGTAESDGVRFSLPLLACDPQYLMIINAD